MPDTNDDHRVAQILAQPISRLEFYIVLGAIFGSQAFTSGPAAILALWPW